MFRRSRRRDTAERRAKFIANRERVRSWIGDWEFPEVEWLDFCDFPDDWRTLAKDPMWLEHYGPVMDEYEYMWTLEARPVTPGITEAVATWQFGKGHRFDYLEIEIRGVPDPTYLAEKLALGVHAAALEGWQEEDLQGLHTWLSAAIDSCPMDYPVRGQRRSGSVMFELECWPRDRTEITVILRTTLTPDHS